MNTAVTFELSVPIHCGYGLTFPVVPRPLHDQNGPAGSDYSHGQSEVDWTFCTFSNVLFFAATVILVEGTEIHSDLRT